MLIQPKNPAVPQPQLVDVRDVARGLVAALKAPPASQVGRKRILFTSKWVPLAEIADFVRKERPELAERINENIKNAPTDVKPVTDNRRYKEVLGLEVTPWQTTVLDGLDQVLELEKYWKTRGVTLP